MTKIYNFFLSYFFDKLNGDQSSYDDNFGSWDCFNSLTAVFHYLTFFSFWGYWLWNETCVEKGFGYVENKSFSLFRPPFVKASEQQATKIFIIESSARFLHFMKCFFNSTFLFALVKKIVYPNILRGSIYFYLSVRSSYKT